MNKDDQQQQVQLDAELVELYRSQANEQPTAEVDAAILAQAAQRCQTSSSPQVISPPVSFWRRHRWPLSSAASVVMVVGLVWLNDGSDPMNMPPELAEPAIAPMATSPAAFSADMPASADMGESVGMGESAAPAQLMQKRSQGVNVTELEQLLSQVELLVDAQQNQQAQALLSEVVTQYPQITEPQHPQYQRYQALQSSLQ
ncbi:hypothetical protein [Shewanella waksmanii]|uniref:hypothetical protein n=1 Tax=Shewanella waksmanii TaxID=213783 RepID=UPI0037363306